MIGTKALASFEKEAKEQQRLHGGTAPGKPKTLEAPGPQVNERGPQSRDKLAATLGISGRTVARAKRIETDGIRAAAKAGIAKVWCWVESMADEGAYMELVTSNAQGELSPLEIGLHALRCESLAKGGRGKKGGLTEYAEKIGRSHQYISQVRNAAEVLGESKPATQVAGLLDKAKHLSAIHAMPKTCWPKTRLAIPSASGFNAGIKQKSVSTVQCVNHLLRP